MKVVFSILTIIALISGALYLLNQDSEDQSL